MWSISFYVQRWCTMKRWSTRDTCTGYRGHNAVLCVDSGAKGDIGGCIVLGRLRNKRAPDSPHRRHMSLFCTESFAPSARPPLARHLPNQDNTHTRRKKKLSLQLPISIAVATLRDPNPRAVAKCPRTLSLHTVRIHSITHSARTPYIFAQSSSHPLSRLKSTG